MPILKEALEGSVLLLRGDNSLNSLYQNKFCYASHGENDSAVVDYQGL